MTTDDNESPAELLANAPDSRDISAELAAPPRPRLPWVTLGLAGGLIAVLGFTGGVFYEKDNTSSSTRASAPQGQGTGGFGGNRPNGTGGFGGGQGANGAGFTRGTVKAVDGTTVYLTDPTGNTIKVTTGDSTKVTLNTTGKVGDLQPGQTVTVIGSKGSDGSYAATQLSEGAGGFGGRGGGQPAPSGN